MYNIICICNILHYVYIMYYVYMYMYIDTYNSYIYMSWMRTSFEKYI